MVLEVKKKEKETAQSLVYRFGKIVRQSGILTEAKKRKFRGRVKSALAKKKSALRKIELQKERKKAEKMAKPK